MFNLLIILIFHNAQAKILAKKKLSTFITFDRVIVLTSNSNDILFCQQISNDVEIFHDYVKKL